MKHKASLHIIEILDTHYILEYNQSSLHIVFDIAKDIAKNITPAHTLSAPIGLYNDINTSKPIPRRLGTLDISSYMRTYIRFSTTSQSTGYRRMEWSYITDIVHAKSQKI